MATTFDRSDQVLGRPHPDAGMAYGMALAMAAVIVAGFSLNLAMGRSSFAVPIIYHIHAVAFFSWTGLFVLQTRLAASASIPVHRRLGKLAALLAPVLVALGWAMVVTVLRRNGGPFFFAQNEFLWGNALLLSCFVGLIGAAVVRRRDTAWHSRLMLTAMCILTGPGTGRILPMPLFIPYGWWVNTALSLAFPLVGMAIDKRRHGRVHPAWFWAVGAVIMAHVLGEVIAYSAFGISATEALVAGTPGADRPMAAFLP